MNKLLLLAILFLVFLSETFLASNLFSATYDLTGTWDYTLSGNWASGDLGCSPGSPATGTCSIVQTGNAFTFAYTSGVVCDPAGVCTLEGTVEPSGIIYTCSTTDIVDGEGGSVTSTIIFTAASDSSAVGTGTSHYTHPTEEWQCTWGSTIVLSKPVIQPPDQYTLTVNTTGNGSVTLDPPGGSYHAGTQVQLTAVPDSGWSFDRWGGDAAGSQNPELITMDGNKTVSAVFTPLKGPVPAIWQLLMLF